MISSREVDSKVAEDGNLAKVVLREKGKNGECKRKQILDGFSSVWVLITGIQIPRFLQVILNFELE